jgi:O-antigen ligase
MQRRDATPFRRWWQVALVAAAIPLSISRSAIIASALALAIVLPTWTKQGRRLALTAMAGLGILMYVAVPGMAGTLAGLFAGVGQDDSSASRTGSYALAWQFIQRSPVVGRGFWTFLPQYRIHAIAYQGLLIDTGIVGTISLLGVFVASTLTARRVRGRSADPKVRSLAQALAASAAAAAGGFAFFDALGFPMIAGTTFVVFGLVSALERLETDGPLAIAASHPPGELPGDGDVRAS